MREGIRKVVFQTLVKELPQGTDKMIGASKIRSAVGQLITEQDRDKAIEEVLNTFTITTDEKDEFGCTIIRKANNLEEFLKYNTLYGFETLDGICEWYAEFKKVDETEQALKWLETEGYVRVWEKPMRVGKKTYVGVTKKGWEIAHLYK